MQKSHRALLQRRAAAISEERKRNTSSRRLVYKVSLSIVLLLWGLVFLLNFLISHGNGCGEELKAEPTEACCKENELDSIKSSDSITLLETCQERIDEVVQDTKLTEKSSLFEEKSGGTDEPVPKVDMSSSTAFKEREEKKEATKPEISPEKEARVKNDRLSRVAPDLDEFKSRAIASKERTLSSQTHTVILRLEPGGKEYNYASAKKGAKVLDSNKEAKGASNILDKDRDKYLRNPCSVEDKFVIIELSEETLVDTIEIGNFEHYSSNLKDFELYSSLSYPTDNWIKIGNFTAQNVKQTQRFHLSEPKWARYLKLNLLTHYGVEFYCTLSVVEVYGVDAVERMLEDLISLENKDSKRVADPEEKNPEQVPHLEPVNGNDHTSPVEVKDEISQEGPKPKKEGVKSSVSDTVSDTKPAQIGRMPGDTVLKILLQKVQTLDMNMSVLEKYLEELNSRYAHIFSDFDDDMANKDVILDKIEAQLKNLHASKDNIAKEMGEFQSWKSVVSLQLEQLAQDNKDLRSEFKKVQDHEHDLENRSLVVIFVSFTFGVLAAAKLFFGILSNVFRTQNSNFLCSALPVWFFLLVSSGVIAFILVI